MPLNVGEAGYDDGGQIDERNASDVLNVKALFAMPDGDAGIIRRRQIARVPSDRVYYNSGDRMKFVLASSGRAIDPSRSYFVMTVTATMAASSLTASTGQNIVVYLPVGVQGLFKSVKTSTWSGVPIEELSRYNMVAGHRDRFTIKPDDINDFLLHEGWAPTLQSLGYEHLMPSANGNVLGHNSSGSAVAPSGGWRLPGQIDALAAMSVGFARGNTYTARLRHSGIWGRERFIPLRQFGQLIIEIELESVEEAFSFFLLHGLVETSFSSAVATTDNITGHTDIAPAFVNSTADTTAAFAVAQTASGNKFNAVGAYAPPILGSFPNTMTDAEAAGREAAGGWGVSDDGASYVPNATSFESKSSGTGTVAILQTAAVCATGQRIAADMRRVIHTANASQILMHPNPGPIATADSNIGGAAGVGAAPSTVFSGYSSSYGIKGLITEYKVDQAAFVVDLVELSASMDAGLDNAIAAGGLPIHFPTYTIVPTTLAAGQSGAATFQIPKSVANAITIYSVQISDDPSDKYMGGRLYKYWQGGLSSWQYRLGIDYWPQYPITNEAEGLAETLKALPAQGNRPPTIPRYKYSWDNRTMLSWFHQQNTSNAVVSSFASCQDSTALSKVQPYSAHRQLGAARMHDPDMFCIGVRLQTLPGVSMTGTSTNSGNQLSVDCIFSKYDSDTTIPFTNGKHNSRQDVARIFYHILWYTRIVVLGASQNVVIKE